MTQTDITYITYTLPTYSIAHKSHFKFNNEVCFSFSLGSFQSLSEFVSNVYGGNFLGIE